MIVRWLVIAGLAVTVSVWAYFLRRKPWVVAGAGVVWLIIGVAQILMEQPVGFGFLLSGAVCLLWGGINLLRARKTPMETAA